MKSFDEIYHRAAQRKGGDDALLPMIQVQLKTADELRGTPDDRYLAAMTNQVFKAGFVWRVIENKWDGFELAFWQFNVMRCAHMSPEDIETLTRDERIVRNRQKIITVQKNAGFLLDIQQSYGGFGNLLADWPEDDFVGLLELLKKRAARLGGNSGQYFLRRVGKDGFALGRDVVAALIDAGVIDKEPTSKAAMAKVQAAFNLWRDQSGLGYAPISRTLALSIDAK